MRFELDKVIGHRGACGHAPENTLSSISKAHELGAKWVEFDVMLTGCGEPIVMHDYTLERTTNGFGAVPHVDYNFISSLDGGSWFSPYFRGEKVPTLKELLHHAASLDLGINIEIKPHYGKEQETTFQTLESLKSFWPKSCQTPLISSFSVEVLKILRSCSNEYYIGYLIDSWQKEWQKIIEDFNCTSLHVDHRMLTKERVKQVKTTGRYLLAFTVNDVLLARQLFDWGVDSIFTDFPDQMLEAL
jgi:glycerophosphoryl diester phosphodiesterase